jgi:hypothetical protein
MMTSLNGPTERPRHQALRLSTNVGPSLGARPQQRRYDQLSKTPMGARVAE